MKRMVTLTLLMILGISNPVEAQIWKKVASKVENKAKEQAEKTIDDVANGKQKKKKKKKEEELEDKKAEEVYTEKLDGGFKMYTKFDFVPGNKLLFYDDFSIDNLGDFPSKWDGNGSGELVEVDGKKWFKLSLKTIYMPLLSEGLPESFTVEFDLHATNFREKGGGPGHRFGFWVDDNTSYEAGKNWAGAFISFWTALKTQIRVKNDVNNKTGINNIIEYEDLANYLFDPVHVSIAVNKRRMRFWINEKKVVDVPRLVPEADWKVFKFRLEGYDDPFLISNFKVATGNRDIREELIKEGRFSTNAIQFDSGSAAIKPESYGVLKQIAAAIKQDKFKIHIVGHTDSDGAEDTNLILSEKRAIAVKEALISSFDIDKVLLSTEGKGATEPIEDNTSPEGKAKNRRVEFVKLE